MTFSLLSPWFKLASSSLTNSTMTHSLLFLPHPSSFAHTALPLPYRWALIRSASNSQEQSLSVDHRNGFSQTNHLDLSSVSAPGPWRWKDPAASPQNHTKWHHTDIRAWCNDHLPPTLVPTNQQSLWAQQPQQAWLIIFLLCNLPSRGHWQPGLWELAQLCLRAWSHFLKPLLSLLQTRLRLILPWWSTGKTKSLYFSNKMIKL